MTFYVDNKTTFVFHLELEKSVTQVISKIIEQERFLYDFELNLQITNNEGIKKFNAMFRKIDKETDVLSFPNLDFETPGIYSCLDKPETKINYLNLDTNEIILGDIIISYEKVMEQATLYGHSVTREFCFLIAHSMLHLLGYDHMDPEAAKQMEAKQESILISLGITKDIL